MRRPLPVKALGPVLLLPVMACQVLAGISGLEVGEAGSSAGGQDPTSSSTSTVTSSTVSTSSDGGAGTGAQGAGTPGSGGGGAAGTGGDPTGGGGGADGSGGRGDGGAGGRGGAGGDGGRGTGGDGGAGGGGGTGGVGPGGGGGTGGTGGDAASGGGGAGGGGGTGGTAGAGGAGGASTSTTTTSSTGGGDCTPQDCDAGDVCLMPPLGYCADCEVRHDEEVACSGTTCLGGRTCVNPGLPPSDNQCVLFCDAPPNAADCELNPATPVMIDATNHPANVDCLGPVCNGKTFQCVGPHKCWLSCNNNACADVTLNCSADGPCHLECYGAGSCAGTPVVNCGANACRTECNTAGTDIEVNDAQMGPPPCSGPNIGCDRL